MRVEDRGSTLEGKYARMDGVVVSGCMMPPVILRSVATKDLPLLHQQQILRFAQDDTSLRSG
jgi:hypothetical protein